MESRPAGEANPAYHAGDYQSHAETTARKLTSVPRGGAQRVRTSRQQPPVSCHFCRARKLRCNRGQPCSNCLARNIPCENPSHPGGEAVEKTAAVRSASPACESAKNVPCGGPPGGINEIQQLRDRVVALERLVAVQCARWDSLVARHPGLFDSAKIDSREYETVEALDQGRPLRGSSIPSTDRISSETPTMNISMTIKERPIHEITSSVVLVHESPYTKPWVSVRVPQFSEAAEILERYIDDLSCFCYLIPGSVLRDMVMGIYASVHGGPEAPQGQLVLFLSILASTMHFGPGTDQWSRTLASARETAERSSLWLQAAQDMVEICHKNACLSLEMVQGMIIMGFVIGNTSSFSYRFRSLHNQALMIGRELGLHLIDHPSRAGKTDPSHAELGRRAWWYLIATNWLMPGRYNEPNEATYQMSPSLVVVKKPLHINDDDFAPPFIERPLGQPTVMSYFLQRVRLAEISKRLLDRLSAGTAAGTHQYEAIDAADRDLVEFIDNLPPFFRISGEPYTSGTPPNIMIQAYFVNAISQTQRCRLHLSYLRHGATDPRYQHSRVACTEAARAVIHAEMFFETQCSAFNKTRLNLMEGLYGVFIAGIALAMDVHQSRMASARRIRCADLGEAIRMLESAASRSELALTLLRSMMDILRRNKMTVPEAELPNDEGAHHQEAPEYFAGADSSQMRQHEAIIETNGDFETAAYAQPASPFSVLHSAIPGADDMALDGDLSGCMALDLAAYFDDVAHGWEEGVGLDEESWSAMLAELDGSFS